MAHIFAWFMTKTFCERFEVRIKPFIRPPPSMAARSTEINSKLRTFVSQNCCNWNKNLFPFIYDITLVGWWRGGLSASLAQSAGKSKGCSSKNINYPNFQKSQKTNFFQRIMNENQVSFTNFCLLSIKLRGIRCSRSCRFYTKELIFFNKTITCFDISHQNLLSFQFF